MPTTQPVLTGLTLKACGRKRIALEDKEMAISKWVLLLLVLAVAAGLAGSSGLSSVPADLARALFDAFLIIFVVLLVLGFTVYRA
jgi:uncharacterized membrane protein YtjA (UPF0391 family)